MSVKLYPPNIEGTITAFYEDTITVPFVMNKTVNKNEIGGFKLLIKTVHSNKILGAVESFKSPDDKIEKWDLQKGIVTFNLAEKRDVYEKLKVGNYYKIQLAYIYSDKTTIGYYSSVGIIKYTTKPKVEIAELKPLLINTNNTSYTGTYDQKDQDITEKAYKYIFNIYNSDNTLYESSGELLHNSFEDENAYSSRDIYIPKKDLLINESYYIQYTVITTNGLKIPSNKYRIMQKDSVEPEIQAEILVNNNREDGYINVTLSGAKDEDGAEQAVTGSLIIKRSCSKDNFTEWVPVLQFQLIGQCPSKWTWKDFTVEHGYTYKYSLQQFNSENFYSNKIESKSVLASFEDAFLYDGKRQLKIKYNPKISSFKTNILQSKIDTIGSKYPFIFRNGKVSYKEFPISGLISYHMDDQHLFLDEENLLVDGFETNLTDKNIASERIFKQEVLNWLNNGEIKLFRSPTEGNFIIKTLNVSLSPNDTLGRMLHTFSCTAYEVDSYNYNTLLDKGFIVVNQIKDGVMQWKTVELFDFYNNSIIAGPTGINLLDEGTRPATSLKIENVLPGTQFLIDDGTNENIITIGATGSYEIDLSHGVQIQSVKLNTDNVLQGQITYSYQSIKINTFDYIKTIDIEDVPLRQFIGETDLLSEIEDVKTELSKINFLYFQKRNVVTIYYKNGSYYWDKDCLNKIVKYDSSFIYLIKEVNSNNIRYADGRPDNTINNYSNSFTIDGINIDLTERGSYMMKTSLNKIKSFTMGSGLTLDCSYQTRIKNYNFEDNDTYVANKKEIYNNTLKNYKDMLFCDSSIVSNPNYINIINGETTFTSNYFFDLENLRIALDIDYQNYIKAIIDSGGLR